MPLSTAHSPDGIRFEARLETVSARPRHDARDKRPLESSSRLRRIVPLHYAGAATDLDIVASGRDGRRKRAKKNKKKNTARRSRDRQAALHSVYFQRPRRLNWKRSRNVTTALAENALLRSPHLSSNRLIIRYSCLIVYDSDEPVFSKDKLCTVRKGARCISGGERWTNQRGARSSWSRATTAGAAPLPRQRMRRPDRGHQQPCINKTRRQNSAPPSRSIARHVTRLFQWRSGKGKRRSRTR